MTVLAVTSHTTVPVDVVGVVLCAAVLHATWNAMAHAITDRLVGFGLIGVAYMLCGLVIVVVAPAPARACWPFLAGSAALHVAYNALLMRCYQLGEFGQVYPLARGTSPWLVAITAAVFASETLSPLRLLGVIVISVGLASLVFAGGRPSRVQWPAIAAALLTGVVIAAYTTVDGLGVRQAVTVAGYTGWLFLLQGPFLPIAAVGLRRDDLWRVARPHLAAGLGAGILAVLSYALVLWAQTRGALAPIAALRETSVIVGAIIGAVLFHERFGRWRVLATCLVVAGVVLINV